jgi:hypothetical protein
MWCRTPWYVHHIDTTRHGQLRSVAVNHSATETEIVLADLLKWQVVEVGEFILPR